MEILVAREPINKKMLEALAKEWHFSLVKGVVDIERGYIALGGEWHMDANNRLIEEGSRQEHLWGFNIYPKEHGNAAIEYISLINIRPAQGNRSMEVASEEVRMSMHNVVARIIPFLGL
ncbi:MAG: DUF5674 family protein [Candidatus Kaiserbacteria bacterium]|nr:DUF5674 family protein [Candidatus Kaiserbacteria bacterium]